MKSCFFEIVSFVDYQAASDRGSATMEGTSAATGNLYIKQRRIADPPQRIELCDSFIKIVLVFEYQKFIII